nr:MAG: hypothetical protein [Bacteriophage sp.]
MGMTQRNNNFGLLLREIGYIDMIRYLTRFAMNYTKQNQKVNTWQRISKISLKLLGMNSGTKITKGLLIAIGAMLLYLGSKNNAPIEEVSIAPSRLESPLTRLHYLSDSLGIKPREEKKKQWYKYRVEIETIPENQIYKIEKSGYQQYEVSRLGETYSYVTYEFISDKVMTTQEAYDFVNKHPERCTRVPNTSQDNLYDKYNEDYEDYINDPEDEINYPPEIFDFLAD